jgi:ABC-type antimicrobial peptide transport system permease subunit
MARESWGSAEAAIGKRFREYDSMPWREVVGVVQDVRENGVMQAPPAMVYWPTLLHDVFGPGAFDATRSVTFAVRSNRAGMESLIAEAQQAVWSVNLNLPVASIRTMQDIYAQSLDRASFTLVMLGIAAAMALLLGIIGIYGVISYSVSQRIREIGIRLALGAQKSELRWMFVRSALVLTAIGVAIGLGAAAGLTQLMKSLLFGVSPIDPFTYFVIPLVLGISAAVASYLPAHRAADVDPVEALRAE